MNANVKVNENLEAGTGRLGKASVPMGGSLKFEPDASARLPYL